MARPMSRAAEIIAAKKIGKTTFYKLVKQGVLPQPVKLDRASLWFDDEMDAAFEALQRGVAPDPKAATQKSLQVRAEKHGRASASDDTAKAA